MEYTHVRCLNNVSDDEGVYCLEGKIYEIFFIDEKNKLFHIETEEVDCVAEMTINFRDNDFEFLKLTEL